MTPEQHQQFIEEIKIHTADVIRKTVNGKIDSLREEIKPVMEAYRAAQLTGSFMIWISKIMLAVGVIVASIIAFIHFNQK